jgi:hypothetical protein
VIGLNKSILYVQVTVCVLPLIFFFINSLTFHDHVITSFAGVVHIAQPLSTKPRMHTLCFRNHIIWWFEVKSKAVKYLLIVKYDCHYKISVSPVTPNHPWCWSTEVWSISGCCSLPKSIYSFIEIVK